MDKYDELIIEEMEDLGLISEDFRHKIYDELFDFCKDYDAKTGTILNFMILVSGEILAKTLGNLILSLEKQNQSMSEEEIDELRDEWLASIDNFLGIGVSLAKTKGE